MFLTKELLQKPKIRTATVDSILGEDGNPVQIRFRPMSGREAESLEQLENGNVKADTLVIISTRISACLVDENDQPYLTPDDVAEAPLENQIAILKTMVSSFNLGVSAQGEESDGVPSVDMPTN